MSFTIVYCDAGHRIHASRRLAGQVLECPKCAKPVLVRDARDEDSNSFMMVATRGEQDGGVIVGAVNPTEAA